MEQTGAGSDEAWQILGRVLGKPVERLRPAISPARGNWWIAEAPQHRNVGRLSIPD